MNRNLLLLILAGAGAMLIWAVLGRRREAAPSAAAPSDASAHWAALQEQREAVGSSLLQDFLTQPEQAPVVTPASSGSSARAGAAGATTVRSPPSETGGGVGSRSGVTP